MYKRTIAALFLLHHLSLASAAEQPLVVESTELRNYWTPDPRPFSAAAIPRGVMSTEVEVAYTINKKGKVGDVEVLSAKPDNTSATWAVRAIKASRYVATAANADHTPVRTTATITLSAKPGN